VSLGKLLASPVRYRLWRPRHLALVFQDLTGAARQPLRDRRVHLEAAIGWLCRAQDRRDGHPDAGGVSAGWSFEDGWLPSYPETSGYIVETFLAAAQVLGRPELRARAARILDWELSIQNPDGSYPGHFGEPGSHPVIFNTGQIMHGMVAGFLDLGREECLESALRAGAWLADCQDADGCWRRNEHNGVPHTYNTRTTWALVRVARLAGDDRLERAAVRNLGWALSQQTPSGWFATNGFTLGQTPFTHTIAYAIRGLLESGLLLGEERFVDSAVRAARALALRQREDGWLAGTYGDGWVPRARYACLTGVAQMALNWQRIRDALGDSALQPRIDRALGHLLARQRVLGNGAPEDGALAGSAPIWGDYSRFEFPNWATKFLADALIMELAPVVVPPVVTRAGQPRVAAGG
jgi:hypothetical protein